MGRGILFLASGFVLIFGIVQMSLQDRQTVMKERSVEYYYAEQSQNIAAAMMEIALAELNDNLGYPSMAETEINILNGKGEVRVTITGAIFLKTNVKLKIKGIIKHGDAKTVTTIIAKAKRYPFSHFAYFTDEGSSLFWVTGSSLNGPMHSNGRINIWGDPVFNGKVTSPKEPFMVQGSDPEFNGGYNWDAAPIKFPPEINIVDKAKEGGLWYDKTIKVIFKKNGKVKIKEQVGTEKKCTKWKENENCKKWQQVPKFGNARNFDMDEFNGIISSSEKVYVEGTLNGRVTLHSKKDIIITGDIQYENTNFGNGDENADQEHEEEGEGEDDGISDDLLGIVSEGDVVVEEDAYSDSGDEDVVIHGSIFALGSFKVEDYRSDYFGTLFMVGGIIQSKDGITGMIQGNGNITGFHQDISYDVRLLENSTNGFPKTDRYSVEYWRETTETIPISN